ncbi:MAG: carboxylesterase family protein, partial [Lachnospiraceae bacterium]|nr:carboxylesterase family protein [Lachnospiraceae bacterium]
MNSEQCFVTLHTALGDICGLEKEECRVFLGVPFADAGRFEYAVLKEHWDGVLQATAPVIFEAASAHFRAASAIDRTAPSG